MSVDAVIEALVNARRTRVPADAAPLANALVSPDDTYLVQQGVANEFGWLDAGVPRHWKSGGASRSATLMHGALPYAARDWSAQACRVQIGAAVHEFRGTHSLQDPAYVLRDWLRHATADGGTVTAGTVVTTGTWCGALEAQRGDAVSVQFAGIGEARLQF